ncbi:MAG: hypothetical protein ACKO96_09685, partial [Flammeovirgaceae bacterium]
CPCAATREALDILGAVATFACRGRNAKTTRLSDQVLTITFYLRSTFSFRGIAMEKTNLF